MKSHREGFTLIELLVVIAIIALLLSILVPGLRVAKEYAASAVCLTNQKNLCLAWVTYYEENNGLLVGGSNYFSGGRATPYRWVEPPLNTDRDNPETTGEATIKSMQTRINGIRAGKLFPYTQDPSLYHCPGDRTFVKEQEPYAIYRSYAITGLMNGEDFGSRVGGLYTPIASYRSVGTKKLYCITKFTDVRAPGNKFVFMEEDVTAKSEKQQYNKGGFVLMASGLVSWWDWPAYYHNDSSTIGFADGHAERIRWHDSDTLALMKTGLADPKPAENEDLQFLTRGYVPKP